MTQDLKGKKAYIFGVANERSLAWGIAKSLHARGAELGFTYVNEKMEKRVRPLAESVGAKIIEPCDVSNDEEIKKAFDVAKNTWGEMDILVHSIGFANREDLEGRFVDTSREGFKIAMDISCYSLIAMCKHAHPLMKGRQGRVITLSYYGAEKVVPNYNVMGVAKAALESSVRYLANDLGPDGITVNAISAGPVKTLAAAGIRDFRTMLGSAQEKAPMRELITPEDVGEYSAFLCSPGAHHVTGNVMYLDSGAHIMGS